MRMKSRRTLAILLCMVLLLALAPSGFAVDLDTPNTLTVNFVPDDSGYREDLKTARIQVDLYLLAEAEAHETDDSYIYTLPAEGTPFHDEMVLLNDDLADAEKPEEQNNRDTVFEKFEPYAQAFAGIVLDSASDIPWTRSETAVAGDTTITLTDLKAGLYLLIIRGADLTEKSEDPEKGYVKKTEQASGGESAEKSTVYATRVVTDDYEYLYRPQLLTVPTKLSDKSEQQYNTAYGEWINKLTIYAKPTREANNGDLKIIKNIINPGPDPVTFVFEVSWTGKDNARVTKVVSMTFEGQTRREYDLLNSVPIGAEVTVTEVHSGIAYTAEISSQTIPAIAVTPPAEPGSKPVIPNVVEFTNDHTGPGGGHGVLNRFTAGETGNFEWSRYSDSLAAADTAADSNG